MVLEVGSLVVVHAEPYGLFHLGWAFEGHIGKITQIALWRAETIYYVLLEGANHSLPFRESELLELGEGAEEAEASD